MKVSCTITLPAGLKKTARDCKLNISQICTSALEDAVVEAMYDKQERLEKMRKLGVKYDDIYQKNDKDDDGGDKEQTEYKERMEQDVADGATDWEKRPMTREAMIANATRILSKAKKMSIEEFHRRMWVKDEKLLATVLMGMKDNKMIQESGGFYIFKSNVKF